MASCRCCIGNNGPGTHLNDNFVLNINSNSGFMCILFVNFEGFISYLLSILLVVFLVHYLSDLFILYINWLLIHIYGFSVLWLVWILRSKGMCATTFQKS